MRNTVYCGLFVLIALADGAVGQVVPTFEDEPVEVPATARTKGAGQGTSARLSSFGVNLAEVRTSVPILLPTSATKLKSLELLADEVSYTGVLALPGHTITLYGTRRVAIVNSAASSSSSSGSSSGGQSNIRIDKTEFGYQASFKEFGANYLVSLECAKKEDPRCKNGSYVYAVSKDLVVYLPE